jgi:hypothetical protein
LFVSVLPLLARVLFFFFFNNRFSSASFIINIIITTVAIIVTIVPFQAARQATAPVMKDQMKRMQRLLKKLNFVDPDSGVIATKVGRHTTITIVIIIASVGCP